MVGDLPLVGRAEELEYVRSAIVGGRGVVAAGVAGVGKTRLAREAAATFGGWYVAWASVTPAAGELPLGGVAGLGLHDVSGWPENRAGLLSRLTAALAERASGRRVLVVVDDAHWLDELSSTFINQLVTSGSAAVLLTIRTGQQPPSGVVALYKDAFLPRLEIQPLGFSEFGSLASAAVGGTVDPATLQRLWADAAGNVLFLRELLADALETGSLAQRDGLWRWTPNGGVGARLAEVVSDRMGRLKGDRRLLAELLAVGEPLGAAMVTSLVPGVDLVEEERRGLVTVKEAGRRTEVRLDHPLFGEVVRSRLSVLARRELQGRLADAWKATSLRRANDVLRLAVCQLESATVRDAGFLLGAARLARQEFDPKLAGRLGWRVPRWSWGRPSKPPLSSERH